MSLVTLQSTDNVQLKISRNALKLSEVLNEAVETCDNLNEPVLVGRGSDASTILHDIKGPILKIIVDYLNEYEEKTRLLDQESIKRLTNNKFELLFQEPWVAKYIKPKWNSNELVPEGASDLSDMDRDTLFETIKSAHYLDIDSLEKLGCRQIAKMIQGKSIEEMKKAFGLVDDEVPK